MNIVLENIGKKYNRDWIFRKISLEIKAGESLAILGSNGSGKSTLLQILSGRLSSTEGNISWNKSGLTIETENVFRQLSLATPYQELIEEFTLEEMLHFHAGLKPLLPEISEAQLTEILALKGTSGKQIRLFSSGMKQRVKLALAILSDVSLVLLDEPCANLDGQGVGWYLDLVKTYRNDRTFVVCSNHQHEETGFCTATININDYK